MKKHKFFVQDSGTFQPNFLVIVGEDIKAIAKFVSKNWSSESELIITEIKRKIDNTGLVGSCISENGKAIVWLRKWEKDNESISILVHELHHLVNGLLKPKNIYDEETFAYQIEYLTKNILDKLNG